MKYKKYYASKKSAKKYNIPGGICQLYSDCPTKRLSAALIEQNGRYPEKGFRKNEYCTESIFVIEGQFELTVKKEKFKLNPFDIFYIPLKTPYSIKGKGKALVFIEPRWNSKQNTEVK